MSIYLKNNHAKFHSDPIWNDGVLGFFEKRRPKKKNKNNNKMSSNMGSVPNLKVGTFLCIIPIFSCQNICTFNTLCKQDSIAIAKKTARCAQYMGALKSFESPRKRPRLLFFLVA